MSKEEDISDPTKSIDDLVSEEVHKLISLKLVEAGTTLPVNRE